MRFSVTQSMLYTKNLKEKYFIALFIREQVKIMTILLQFLYILFRHVINADIIYIRNIEKDISRFKSQKNIFIL